MCSILLGARGGGIVVSHVDDALDTVNINYAPGKAGNNVNAMAVGGNTTIN